MQPRRDERSTTACEFDEESEDFVYGGGIGANIGEKFNLRFEYETIRHPGLWMTPMPCG
jgi:hypothetical protein